MIYTIRQFEFLPITTSRTVLRSVGRIYLNHSFTSIFCFIFDKIKKHLPCRIAYAKVNAAKVIFLHIVDGQIFNNNSIKSIYKFTRFLMSKVLSFPANSFMHTGNYFTSLCSGFSSLLLSGELALNLRKRLFFFTEKTRIFNLFSVRQSSERLKSHINSNSRFNGLLNRNMFNITGKSYNPFPRWCTPDSTGFNCAFGRTMEFDFNTTYFGKLDNIPEKFKSRLRITKRIISELSPKSWITGLITRFDAPEESPESKINSHGNVLKNLTVNIIQKRLFFFKCFKRITLIISRKTFLFGFPSSLTLFKQMVVKPTATIKSSFKGCRLFMCWKNPVFKCLSHGIYTIYIVLYNVKNYLKERRQFIPTASRWGILAEANKLAVRRLAQEVLPF